VTLKRNIVRTCVEEKLEIINQLEKGVTTALISAVLLA
jgi:hypothetical protein